MALEKSTETEGIQSRVELWAFVSLCILLTFLARGSLAQNVSMTSGQSGSDAITTTGPNNTVGETDEIDYWQFLRDIVAAAISKAPRPLVRKVLAVEVRLECRTALLRTMRALQNFEPWALRLLDATGKYPSGFLEASHVDMGAFDECLETAVRDRNGNVLSRGQYCNLLVYSKNATAVKAMLNYMSDAMDPLLVYFSQHAASPENPLARLALCYIDDCNQHDLQVIANAISPPFVRLEVSNCVTAEPKPWSKSQIAIVIFAVVLMAVIIISTLADHFVEQQSQWRKKHGIAFQVAKAFSAKSNTRMLLHVASKDQVEQRSLQFVHGIRCLSAMHVVLGHVNVMTTDSCTRLLSLLQSSTKWQNMLVAAAFNSIDTFFFLSGFFLCHILGKQKGNGAVVFIVAMIRRMIRIYVPLFFVIMWFYLLPRFINGPDTETFFQRFYVDISEHWWMFLIPISNLFENTLQRIFIHPWFLSTDFQLFVFALLTLLTFKRRKRMALAVLAMPSLLGCAIATWTMARWHLPPFLIMPYPDISRMMRTVNDYYMKPFYHAVCYFSGCMTCLIVADFRKRKISKTLQFAGWCVSVSCALFSVFVKLPWYLKEHPASNDVEIVVAFFDRILWSISIAWLTLACSTGRGGPVSKLLSWNAFVPLSKLTYGVYLIHLPLFELMMHSSRERVDFSEFNRATVFFGVLLWCYVLSYFAFITCEAPTAALDKLVFGRLIRGCSSLKHEHQELLEDSNLKKDSRGGDNNEMSLR